MIDSNNSFHLKGLDGLRCIGTLIILFYHLELGKEIFGIASFGFQKNTGLGQSAMTLFFVLSGFLIFYLLFKEKSNSGNINVASFYKRRMARIWPVYYIVLFSALLLFDNSSLFVKPDVYKHAHDKMALIAVYFFHLPNFNLFFVTSLAAVGHLWSLGVEEQFYAIAPWIIKKTENYVKAFLIIICIKIGLKLFFALLIKFFPFPEDVLWWIKRIERFLYKMRFEAFSLGGIAAYLFIEKKHKVLNFVYRPSVQFINIIFLILTIPLGKYSESIQVVYAICFALIILNIVGNDKAVFMPDYKFTNYIGKISYGMYMYQIPIIYLVIGFLMPSFGVTNPIVWQIIYYISSFAFCILVSAFSYEVIEKKVNRWAHQKKE